MKFLDRDGVGRREFLKGAVASLGGVILPVSAFGDSSKKLLSFGVVSDVHMASKPTTEKDLESVLRHFDAAGVDAVMVPGDISHADVRDHAEGVLRQEGTFPQGGVRDLTTK